MSVCGFSESIFMWSVYKILISHCIYQQKPLFPLGSHFYCLSCLAVVSLSSGVSRNFFLRGVTLGIFFRGAGSTNLVEERGSRERGSGGGSPKSGVPLNSQVSDTCILIRLLWMHFPRNWEFGSTLSKLRNFRGGGVFEPLNHPPSLVRHGAGGTHNRF
jgi:hypothetical protein